MVCHLFHHVDSNFVEIFQAQIFFFDYMGCMSLPSMVIPIKVVKLMLIMSLWIQSK